MIIIMRGVKKSRFDEPPPSVAVQTNLQEALLKLSSISPFLTSPSDELFKKRLDEAKLKNFDYINKLEIVF